MSSGSLFCFGLGYSAGFLARALAAQGWDVTGTSRTDNATGPFPLSHFERDHPLAHIAQQLAGVTHLLISIPPDETGCPVLDRHGNDIAALTKMRWIGYLSSTNVYGDRGGDWVDETTQVAPQGERGRRRVAVEAGWQTLGTRSGIPVQVFRLAGIYGPGRSALDTLRAGTARRIVKPGQVFSRIHVEDVATALMASMAKPRAGAIYNLCDDTPSPPADVITYAAELLGIAPPPLEDFATAVLSPMARSFYDDNKRVANQWMKDELGVVLKYPSYREGLRAILCNESA